MKLTVVTPCYNEGENIFLFHQKLHTELLEANIEWDWIIVDDGSAYPSYIEVQKLANQFKYIKVIRLSRNMGSHIASFAGMCHSSADMTALMAIDLQDDPSYLKSMVQKCSEGYSVVWAQRHSSYKRPGFLSDLTAQLYYKLLPLLIGKEVHKNGADFVLVSKVVINELKKVNDVHLNILELISILGFRSTSISYKKMERSLGKSKWTLSKKINLFTDSIFLNTAAPLRLMGGIGLLVSVSGFCYAFVVIFSYYKGHPYPGWSSLIVVVLVLCGLILLNLALIGEYIWRILLRSRRIPTYSIEQKINF